VSAARGGRGLRNSNGERYQLKATPFAGKLGWGPSVGRRVVEAGRGTTFAASVAVIVAGVLSSSRHLRRKAIASNRNLSIGRFAGKVLPAGAREVLETRARAFRRWNWKGKEPPGKFPVGGPDFSARGDLDECVGISRLYLSLGKSAARRDRTGIHEWWLFASFTWGGVGPYENGAATSGA